MLALLTLPALPSVTGAASADPGLGDARREAAALRTAVDQLQVQMEQEDQAYDAAQSELAAVVTERLSAQQRSDEARRTATDVGTAQQARARLLYEAGGPQAVYATALASGGDVSTVLTRYHAAADMFGVGARQSLQADGRVGRAAAAEARLRGLAARQTGLQRAVQDQATRLRVALARQQALLAAADGRVRALAEEQCLLLQ